MKLAATADITVDDTIKAEPDGGYCVVMGSAAVTALVIHLEATLSTEQVEALFTRYQGEELHAPDDLRGCILFRIHDVLSSEAMGAAQQAADDEGIIAQLRQGNLSALGCEF